MNRTICIDKHEIVVDKDYIEELKEINADLSGACELLLKMLFKNNAVKQLEFDVIEGKDVVDVARRAISKTRGIAE